MREFEILAQRRELVRTSAARQRRRAGVRRDRLQGRGSPVFALALDLGRRLLAPNLALAAVSLLARRWFASRAR